MALHNAAELYMCGKLLQGHVLCFPFVECETNDL